MARTRHLIENHAGLERIDGKQRRQRHCATDQAADLRELHLANLAPAIGDQIDVASAGRAQLADHQIVALEDPHRRLNERQSSIR